MNGDIAIVGMGCLFPGARTPTEFWENLLEGRDSTSQATAADLGAHPNVHVDPRTGQTDKTYWLRGGYIRDFELDPSGYRLPPDQLAALDCAVTWPLYAAREALMDGGIAGSDLGRCGVVLGNLSFPTRSSYGTYAPIYRGVLESGLRTALAEGNRDAETRFRLPASGRERSLDVGGLSAPASSANVFIAAAPAMLTAEALGLGGPAFALDAACASSLYAIDLACRYLMTGTSDLMLAGGVSAADPLMITLGFSIFRAYPENGESRPLDRSSGGLISGEGAGMVLLKRYADALRDGDRVYARVRGVGLSNDGSGRHPLIPKREGQERAYERAYAGSGIAPESIQYVECHATGTPTGDIVELDSMESFFQAPVLCGSVKSNFGHLLTAAGIASVIKAVLAMKHGTLPPTIGIADPLASAGGTMGGSRVVTEPTPWPVTGFPRRAGVNGFGFGGTNAHLILEAAAPETSTTPGATAPPTGRTSIAITGMDACFGPHADLTAFAHATYEGGAPPTSELPSGRWRGVERRTDVLADYRLAALPAGKYLDGFDVDFLRARVQPEDQPIAQHLLLLKVADNALRDAGIKPGANVAVLVAMDTDLSLHEYRARLDLSWQIRAGLEAAGIVLSQSEVGELETIAKDSISDPGQVNRYMSFIGNIMASRVSALWDFSGPALTLSAGEHSVFRALEVAQTLLTTNEVEAVVVGAVDLAGGVESVSQRNYRATITADEVRSSLGPEADGLLVGEGGGAIVLQRRDGASEERVYATIDGLAVVRPPTQDGSSNGATVLACREALLQAGMDAADVGYIDVQGSVHPDRAGAGDLLDVYGAGNGASACALGSAQAQVGDAGVASPMASLIKAALCLHGRYLPGTPMWWRPNWPERWRETTFYAPTQSRPWFASRGTRRLAAVHGTDTDGSAAHVVLGEAAGRRLRSGPRGTSLNPAALSTYLLPVGGDSVGELEAALDALEKSVRNGTSLAVAALDSIHTSRNGRPRAHTLSLVAGTGAEMLGEIERARSGLPGVIERGSEWSTPAGSYFTAAPLGGNGVCFVYPGGFSSYLGQGAELFHLAPAVFDRLEARVPHLDGMMGERWIYPRSLEPLSNRHEEELEAALLQQSDVATASAGILAIATTSLLRDDFGLRAHSAFGYSLGEATMMWALGIWSDMDAAHARFRSWPGMPMEERARGWRTYLLLASPDRVAAALAQEDDVHLTIVSTEREVFIVGEPAACERVIARLDCGYTPASFSQVLHCPAVHPAHDSLVDLYRYPVSGRSDTTLYSGAQYGPMEVTEGEIARSIATVICQPLDFPRLVHRVHGDGARIFVEMGPGSTCARWIRSALRGKPHVTMAVDQKGTNSTLSLLRTLAKLVSHGVPVDLAPLVNGLQAQAGTGGPAAGGRQALVRRVSLGGPDPDARLSALRGRLRSRSAPSISTEAPRNTPATLPIPVSELVRHSTVVSGVHRHLLATRQDGLRSMTGLVRQQLESVGDGRRVAHARPSAPYVESASPPSVVLSAGPVDQFPRKPAVGREGPVWDESDLLEFAEGSIANVFGPSYAPIDAYGRRVRLPLPPYLLVSRVTHLGATGPGLRPSDITTEYDVPRRAWYTSNGQVPVAVAVEAGQCDLLLISYLGIDFENRGDRVYRLLDCTLTFLADLPREGETLRYEISIDSFARSGDSLLFFFHYRCYANNTLILKMDNGCAGFFTDFELDQGRGVIDTESERAARARAAPRRFFPPVSCLRREFGRSDLEALSRGDVTACFGAEHVDGGRNPSLRLGPPDMLMLDRVVLVEPEGGPWGLGVLVAEKDLRPDDWYFPCHFKGDQVLAGSLVAEGCVQLLQFYLLFLGLHTGLEEAVFQPIADLSQSVRCRGQITPVHSRMTYRMEVVSIEGGAVPSARANVDIIVDGKTVVRFTDLGVQMRGRPGSLVDASRSDSSSRGPVFSAEQVSEFATGSIVACFGPEFAVYERRRTPRIPNGDLQFITRVVEVNGTRGNFTPGAALIVEYDVPPDVWFYRELDLPQFETSSSRPRYDTASDPPYSVLMEIGLQPCGFLSGWLGSTLHEPDEDFYFRNLDGQGQILQHLDLRGRTVRTQVRLRSSTRASGVIIQSFDFELSCAGESFYRGDAVFGYFTPAALEQQAGLDGGRNTATWLAEHPEVAGRVMDLQNDRRLFQGAPHRPHFRLQGQHLDLLDRAVLVDSGGRHGRGYLECSRIVRPDDWFFTCHFYQDPVMPGSLGVEAMVEALQIYAIESGVGDGLRSPRFGQVPGHDTVWKYRGQIRRDSREMRLEIHVRDLVTEPGRVVITADGSLWRDGLRIYEVHNLAVELRGQ